MTILLLIIWFGLCFYLGWKAGELAEMIARRKKAIQAARDWDRARYIHARHEEFEPVEIPDDEQ